MNYLVVLVIETMSLKLVIFSGLLVIVGGLAVIRVQYLLSTNRNFIMISLTLSPARFTSICRNFLNLVGVIIFLSHAAIFRDSDLTQSCNINVVFLESLKYYDASPFRFVCVGFVQYFSYIPCCEVVCLLDLLSWTTSYHYGYISLLEYMFSKERWQVQDEISILGVKVTGLKYSSGFCPPLLVLFDP